MTGTRPEILLRLTEAAFEAARGRLSRLRAREAELTRAIAALDRPGSAPDEVDPARRAGADLLWEAWADGRRRALTAELARLRVEIEAAALALRPAFGRREAAHRMFEEARKAKAREMRRRAERP